MKYWKQFWPLYIVTAVVFVLVAFWTEQTVATIAENAPVERGHIIIIDAGHGGIDGGAISCSGMLESQINLMIALRLEDLCHLLGYETLMIRTEDVSIYTEGTTIAAKKASDLRNRVRMVNSTENGVLLSIHQNSFPDSRYSGAQVFFAATNGSEALAKCLQDAFISSINPGSNREHKRADHVFLMNHILRPGVLIECGFLSNPQEEEKLRSNDYQKKLCCVIAASVAGYLHT